MTAVRGDGEILELDQSSGRGPIGTRHDQRQSTRLNALPQAGLGVGFILQSGPADAVERSSPRGAAIGCGTCSFIAIDVDGSQRTLKI